MTGDKFSRHFSRSFFMGIFFSNFNMEYLKMVSVDMWSLFEKKLPTRGRVHLCTPKPYIGHVEVKINHRQM